MKNIQKPSTKWKKQPFFPSIESLEKEQRKDGEQEAEIQEITTHPKSSGENKLTNEIVEEGEKELESRKVVSIKKIW